MSFLDKWSKVIRETSLKKGYEEIDKYNEDDYIWDKISDLLLELKEQYNVDKKTAIEKVRTTIITYEEIRELWEHE